MEDGVMNAAHLHLLLNHLPVMGTVIGVMLLALARARRSDELFRASLALFALLAVAAVAVYLTGDGAEDLVERLPGASKSLIEAHEEAALIATIALGIYGIAACVTLFVGRFRALPRWTATAALVVSLIPLGLMAWTANRGGQIRHTEIRPGTPAATRSPHSHAQMARAAVGGGRSRSAPTLSTSSAVMPGNRAFTQRRRAPGPGDAGRGDAGREVMADCAS